VVRILSVTHENENSLFARRNFGITVDGPTRCLIGRHLDEKSRDCKQRISRNSRI
jgi:hypothetical protein